MKSKIYKLTGIGSREWSPRAGGRMENREILVKGTTPYYKMNEFWGFNMQHGD